MLVPSLRDKMPDLLDLNSMGGEDAGPAELQRLLSELAPTDQSGLILWTDFAGCSRTDH